MGMAADRGAGAGGAVPSTLGWWVGFWLRRSAGVLDWSGGF